MAISVFGSTEEQAQIVQQTLELMTIPDPSGNSWSFKGIFMYPSCDEIGLFFAIVLKFVDDNSVPIFSVIGRNTRPKHLTNTPWEEIT